MCSNVKGFLNLQYHWLLLTENFGETLLYILSKRWLYWKIINLHTNAIKKDIKAFTFYDKRDVHVLYKAHCCPLVSTNLLDRWPNKMLDCGKYMCFISAYLSNIDPKEQQGEVPCGE